MKDLMKGIQAILLRTGDKRFGKLTAWIRKEIKSIPSVERLEQLAERLLDVTSCQELLSMNTNPRDNRHYTSSPLPTLLEGWRTAPLQQQQDILLKLYSEICSSWRTLTDVRFKLLGLVPAISVFALKELLSKGGSAESLSPIARTGISMLGFVVTLMLWIYERRNSQLYDDLISRGRKIEEELGIGTGQFRGRLKSSKKLVWIPIQHDVAINVIYWIVIMGWVFAAWATWSRW